MTESQSWLNRLNNAIDIFFVTLGGGLGIVVALTVYHFVMRWL